MTSPNTAVADMAAISYPQKLNTHWFPAVTAVHLGAVAAVWETTWAAVGVCFLLHALCGGLGMCVGYHRLLTHRSFKCPRWLEYSLAVLGALCLQGGPVEWTSQHRQHHQHADKPGDPHSAREGFWWSHMFWILWMPRGAAREAIANRYAPDLLQVPFYRSLERLHHWPTILLGVLLYLLGGWPFVVWGVFVRLVLIYHCTWLVNSAGHAFGGATFRTNDLSTNCWWVALISYGEGWHNNHHAFPTSARHGLKFWEIDLAYGFIRTLKALGLAWDLSLPPVERLKAVAP
ncbi:MAG: acyl-CoA desaturase [Candidatus Acidiferrales bacterium]